MKNIIFSILIVLCGFAQSAFSQSQVGKRSTGEYGEIPQEAVFVHYNTGLLFSGEYFYYKMYTVSKTTGLFSRLSKIGYVELVGEDGTRVFSHKLKLVNGKGQGDFFLPTTIPSGNYKLLAYTRWMLNEKDNFFSGDVAVINPYRGDQRAVTPSREVLEGEDAGPSLISSERAQGEPTAQNRHLQLELNGSTFGTREQVLLNFRSPGGTAAGNYSVSVKRLDGIGQPPMPNVLTFKNASERPSAGIDNENKVHLPELRGELLAGKILPKETGDLSVNNKKIILSIPGEDYVVKVAETNARGEFYFNLLNDYTGEEALLEMIGSDKDKFFIEITASPGIDHSRLNFEKFYLTPAMEESILERSVFNQIENAYYSIKPDTLSLAGQEDAFYEDLPVVYNLDDFTRFPTVRETFIEIIKDAAVRNNRIVVRSYENAVAFNMPSLLLVDGVVVQEHADFIDVPATEIQSIALLRNNYFLGPHMFQGVVDVTTINGDFAARYVPRYAKKYELEKPVPVKNYFRQSYSRGVEETVPDFRQQLLWLPNFEMKEKEERVEFYTGEITGDFEVIVKGFTTGGDPVDLRKVFRVE